MGAGVLDGKAALVTGATSGIGRQVAVEMARAGAAVVAVGRDRERLAGVVDEISGAGGTVHGIARDLVEESAAADVVAEAVERAGGIDVLANVAGRLELGWFEQTPLESLDRQYAANVRAPYALTQAALPHLRERRGAVIFLSSGAALAAFPESSAYSASKGAIESLTRQLAVELGPMGVRVNAIAPGEIDTPMNAPIYEAHPGFKDEVAELTPAKRLGAPDDVAPVAVFLASDAARFVYGVSLLVDGGQLAR
jgi:NAD(P)-dependent dehydrogenase (short-subunit alcohol dehydrogenase family)